MLELKTGGSGYFSKPSPTLDPHLFDGEHLKPDVRTRLLDTLYNYLGTKYNNPRAWTMVWLAGSGISYQWAADRGNGDLDVLFGIDYDEFVNNNSQFMWSDRHQIAEAIDKDLKENLWPHTAHEPFYADDGWGYQYYEVTFFLNDNVEAQPDSIVNIRPYAAYNLNTDEWTTRPPKLPENPGNLYPAVFEEHASYNQDAARTLVDRFNAILRDLRFTSPGTPQYINAQAHLKSLRYQARFLYDNIHLGRQKAFSPDGEGYSDYYNYQWQRAKRDGVVTALKSIIGE